MFARISTTSCYPVSIPDFVLGAIVRTTSCLTHFPPYFQSQIITQVQSPVHIFISLFLSFFTSKNLFNIFSNLICREFLNLRDFENENIFVRLFFWEQFCHVCKRWIEAWLQSWVVNLCFWGAFIDDLH